MINIRISMTSTMALNDCTKTWEDNENRCKKCSKDYG